MPTNEGLKQRLMADYERVLDELLAKRASDDEITLSEAEQLVLEAGDEMSEQTLAAFTEAGNGNSRVVHGVGEGCTTRVDDPGRR